MIRKEDWKIKFQNFAWPGTLNVLLLLGFEGLLISSVRKHT